ncbi:MAG: MerR family transcriptional regulator [Bauldia sp.]
MDHRPQEEVRRPQEEVWLTAAECARRIGLTVRALRLYEDRGLITPRRTGKDWRLYGRTEIARLNEVLTLKGFGLSLSRIADLLKGRPVDLAKLLDMQREALADTRDRADRALRGIELARASLATGGTIGLDDLTNLARETAMRDPSKDTLAWRRYEQNRPRTEVAIDPALYADYVGAYELVDGPFYVIVHRADGLFLRVVGEVEFQLFPEAADRFFLKEMPAQLTFVRDGDGRVTSLVHHQYGTDTPGHRADPAAVERAAAAHRERVRSQVAMPDSETILRELIDGEVSGRPLYDRMAPFLAAIAREQIDRGGARFFRDAGPLRRITFRGVSRMGMDVYDVEFENLHTEWGFSQANSGKINGLYIRPSVAPKPAPR